MDTLKFKTNIKCTGCLAVVTPILNEKLGEGQWEVDLMTLKKTLTVTAPDVEEADVIAIVKEAGYTAEVI